MTKNLSRESNIELLRLVAIFFVILHHLTIKGADTVGYITPYSFEEHGIVGVVINSFCICAVAVCYSLYVVCCPCLSARLHNKQRNGYATFSEKDFAKSK